MDFEELRTLIAQHAEPGTSEPMDGVFLSSETQPGAPQLSTTGIGFALIVQGAKQLTLGAQTLAYGPGEYLVTSVNLPVVGRFTEASKQEPALGFGMTLNPVDIAELLLTAGSLRHAESGLRQTAPSALLVGRAGAELIDAIARLLRLLDRAADLRVLGPMARREILWLLLTGPQGETIRHLGLADSKLAPISKAVTWIRENATAPLRVDELAARVGLSTSAFHRTFHAVTGSSPLQFQKQLRLHTARQLLVTGNSSVSQVAVDVGYESATQFNREYRRLFGNPPGRDRLAVLRAPG
ncbi:Virulence regulon transcriptional activator VirF [Actinomadura rubteroloni]|uniref:Virulence regulon transcriptional activator VirF n=1 Tax=Actinomadura rubteroloni TaxID=1926885 RepID=A0A2P4UBZ3_9ACTN|nr:AraC family transcriptional regulator [Actinomadura rubteroloni]POM22571.1 Virulence regulon transcriptional activator VirF [Actinomadura rubteroloni]